MSEHSSLTERAGFPRCIKTIVAPFTTQYDPTDIYPFEVELSADETALAEDSVADLSQIRVVDIETRIQQRIGTVPPLKMAQIDTAIKNSLGLTD